MKLTSSAFQEGETIPKNYTGDGRNTSPPLRWDEPPAGTRGWALVCEDPDAPRGTFTHWLAYNVPAETRELAEGVPREPAVADGTKQGVNDFGKVGYDGPAPPPGKPHRYVYRLLALDRPLDLKPGGTKAGFQQEVKGHVLAEASLVGTYGR